MRRLAFRDVLLDARERRIGEPRAQPAPAREQVGDESMEHHRLPDAPPPPERPPPPDQPPPPPPPPNPPPPKPPPRPNPPPPTLRPLPLDNENMKPEIAATTTPRNAPVMKNAATDASAPPTTPRPSL